MRCARPLTRIRALQLPSRAMDDPRPGVFAWAGRPLARIHVLQLPSRAMGNPRPGVFARAGRPLTKIRVLQLIFGPASDVPKRFAWSGIAHQKAGELQNANSGQIPGGVAKKRPYLPPSMRTLGRLPKKPLQQWSNILDLFQGFGHPSGQSQAASGISWQPEVRSKNSSISSAGMR